MVNKEITGKPSDITKQINTKLGRYITIMTLIVSMCKTSAPKKRVINNSFRWLMRTFWQIIRNWPSWFLLIYFYLPFGCNWLTHATEDFLIRLTEIKSQGHSGIDMWYRYFYELTMHGRQCQYLFPKLFLYSPIMFCALRQMDD